MNTSEGSGASYLIRAGLICFRLVRQDGKKVGAGGGLEPACERPDGRVGSAQSGTLKCPVHYGSAARDSPTAAVRRRRRQGTKRRRSQENGNGAGGGTRTRMGCPTRPSNVRVCHSTTPAGRGVRRFRF